MQSDPSDTFRTPADAHEGIPRIAIVGGGPGGLFTAYELQRLVDRPVAVTIFEASERLGGKVATVRFDSIDLRYEAGAAELYDYSHLGPDPLKELVQELGLPIRAMGGSAMIVDGRIVANLEDVREHLGDGAHDALQAFDRLARDRMTPREFYTSGDAEIPVAEAAAVSFVETLAGIGCDRARRFVEQLIHSDLATEPSRTNEVYGLQNYLMNDPAYMRLYGIVGGNQRLVEELAARVSATVRLGHRVESIESIESIDSIGSIGGAQGARRFAVRSAADGASAVAEFDAVVVALPHDQVARVAFAGRGLRDAVARHHAHHDHPAHYLRATILFDRPFWRDALSESYWMLDRFGGCCLYDESSRDPLATHGILGWLLGGEVARELAGEDDAAIVRAVLDALPEFLAHPLSSGRARVLEARVHRWTGAVSALPGGWSAMPIERRHRPDPDAHPGLFLVGDYLYDSTLNGVLDSAERVAEWIAAGLADGGRPGWFERRSPHDA